MTRRTQTTPRTDDLPHQLNRKVIRICAGSGNGPISHATGVMNQDLAGPLAAVYCGVSTLGPTGGRGKLRKNDRAPKCHQCLRGACLFSSESRNRCTHRKSTRADSCAAHQSRDSEIPVRTCWSSVPFGGPLTSARRSGKSLGTNRTGPINGQSVCSKGWQAAGLSASKPMRLGDSDGT